ncbi:MAG: hypothetical protein WCK21_08330 [Actinomycetota bacterium]
MIATDRRRVVAASIFTFVALSTLWFFSSDSATNKDGSGTAAKATAPPTTKYEPEPPLFVGGNDEPSPPGVINIAVPPAPSASSFRGLASFHRYLATQPRACTTQSAPDGAALTVTNTDNGQTTTCTNTLTIVVPAGVSILLHTGVFTEIGDVADSPIPVRVSW